MSIAAIFIGAVLVIVVGGVVIKALALLGNAFGKTPSTEVREVLDDDEPGSGPRS